MYEPFNGDSVTLTNGDHSTTPPIGWTVDNTGTDLAGSDEFE